MLSDLQIQLSRQVTKLLIIKHWSQARLARETGVTSKHLSHILTGKRAGTLDMWSRLFQALGYEIAIAATQRRPAESKGAQGGTE